jgi:hypothetical protein
MEFLTGTAVVPVQAAWRRRADGTTVPTRAHERLLDPGDRPLDPPAIYQVWPRLLTRARLTGRPGGSRCECPPPILYASLQIAKAIEAGRDRDALLTHLRSQLRHRNTKATQLTVLQPDRQYTGAHRRRSAARRARTPTHLGRHGHIGGLLDVDQHVPLAFA